MIYDNTIETRSYLIVYIWRCILCCITYYWFVICALRACDWLNKRKTSYYLCLWFYSFNFQEPSFIQRNFKNQLTYFNQKRICDIIPWSILSSRPLLSLCLSSLYSNQSPHFYQPHVSYLCFLLHTYIYICGNYLVNDLTGSAAHFLFNVLSFNYFHGMI